MGSWADEWKRSLTEVLNVSSAAAASLGLPQPGTLPGDPFATIMTAARAWLVGKSRTIRFSGHEITMTVEDLSMEGGGTDLARIVGQYGEVSLAARDVEWDGERLERMTVRARNVHLRPGARPTIVTAPVLVEGFISAPAVSRWLATVSPRLELAMVAGVPQIGVVGAPWVRLEVETAGEGRSVLIRPSALRVGDRRLSLPLPPFRAPAPALPPGVTLTAIEPAPGGFTIRGLITEWRRTLSREDIDRLLTTMRGNKDALDV